MNEQIMMAKDKDNSGLRQRKIGEREMVDLENAVTESADNPAVKTIRVYSYQGFVPNAYKYRCQIAYIEAVRQENGEFKFYGGQTDAKRSRGNGALLTINGRAK